ncbi:MAG: hypothetical protein PHO71_25820 [Bacteroides sp.]|nr:hypothetical protein [Bacteroides sp.]
MSEHILSMQEDCKRSDLELQYLRDFISYKGLNKEFQYFRENSHEERSEDLPFSYFTL